MDRPSGYEILGLSVSDFFSVPGLISAAAEGGQEVYKIVQTKQAEGRAAESEAARLQAAIQADIAARKALGQSLYTAALAQADPTNTGKRAQADADARAAQAAMNFQDQAGMGLSPKSAEKRLEAARNGVKAAQAD